MKDQYTIKLQTFASFHPMLYLTRSLSHSALVSFYCMVLCMVAFNGAVK
jgi:hypothetical protein